MDDRAFMAIAIEQAAKSLSEGGVPVGAALVADGRLLAAGHNRRVQQGSAIRHGETDALENAGRLHASVYARATMYTTLSPCDMCTGRDPAVQDPARGHRREPHVHGQRGAAALARRGGRGPRRPGVQAADGASSSRATRRSGTRTSARSRPRRGAGRRGSAGVGRGAVRGGRAGRIAEGAAGGGRGQEAGGRRACGGCGGLAVAALAVRPGLHPGLKPTDAERTK